MTYAVFVDDQDIVWLTDFGANAIVRFDPRTEKFTSYPHAQSNAAVRQLLGRPGEVWAAMSGQDKLLLIRTALRLRPGVGEEAERRVLAGVVVLHAVAYDEALRGEQCGVLQDHPLRQHDARMARRARDRVADELRRALGDVAGLEFR